MAIVITETDGSALTPPDFEVQRGVPSAKKRIRIRNTGAVSVPNLAFVMYAEKNSGDGDYDTEGSPFVDERMGRFQIMAVDSTVTPGQTFVPSQVQILGHLGTGRLPTLLAGDSVDADVWLEQSAVSAGGGTANLQFGIAAAATAEPVPAGVTLVARGVASMVGEIASFLITGRQVTQTGTPDDQVHVADGDYLFNGVEVLAPGTAALTLNQNDVNAVALGTSEAYYAYISQGSVATPVVTKGPKRNSTIGLPDLPSPPDGNIILALVKVLYQSGGTSVILTANITTDLTYGRLLAVAPASGLSVVLHSGQSLTAGFRQFRGDKGSLALAASATNRIWMTPAGTATVNASATPPAPGSLLLWTAVTDGTHVTTLTDERIFVGP